VRVGVVAGGGGDGGEEQQRQGRGDPLRDPHRPHICEC
jgi:hypothetical protein